MTTTNPVPADDEPGSILDLVEDCREVSGVLAPWPGVVRLPGPGIRTGLTIPVGAAGGLEGYGDYGS